MVGGVRLVLYKKAKEEMNRENGVQRSSVIRSTDTNQQYRFAIERINIILDKFANKLADIDSKYKGNEHVLSDIKFDMDSEKTDRRKLRLSAKEMMDLVYACVDGNSDFQAAHVDRPNEIIVPGELQNFYNIENLYKELVIPISNHMNIDFKDISLDELEQEHTRRQREFILDNNLTDSNSLIALFSKRGDFYPPLRHFDKNACESIATRVEEFAFDEFNGISKRREKIVEEISKNPNKKDIDRLTDEEFDTVSSNLEKVKKEKEKILAAEKEKAEKRARRMEGINNLLDEIDGLDNQIASYHNKEKGQGRGE